MKTRNALYLAGAILVGATFVSFFKEAALIWSTIMVLVAIVLLFLGYQKDRKFAKKCLSSNVSKKKIGLVTLGVIAIFFGLGFAVGKLIYLWTN